MIHLTEAGYLIFAAAVECAIMDFTVGNQNCTNLQPLDDAYMNSRYSQTVRSRL